MMTALTVETLFDYILVNKNGKQWFLQDGGLRFICLNMASPSTPPEMNRPKIHLQVNRQKQIRPIQDAKIPYTVRWSNFDWRDPKIGVFLRSTEATPCGHLLTWKLTPENPPVDTMFMAAMAMVLPWKIVEDFQSFVKIRNFDPHFKNLYLAIKRV
jgi:hypothetical protein